MNNNFNIQQLLKSGKDPRELIINALNNNPNPVAKNFLEMVKNNDIKGAEQFARNLLKEQGRDFDAEAREMQNIMNSFK